MSALQPPAFMGGTFPPALLRAYEILPWLQDPSASVLRPLGGVIPRGGNLDMPVTQASTTVTVGAGAVVIPGTESGGQYGYLLINDAPLGIPIPAAPVGQTRRDLIVARVRDSSYSGSSLDGDLVLVQGTPAAGSPALPSAPPNSVIIAETSTTGTANPVATSRAGYTCAVGGIRPARGGTVDDLVPPQYAGQYRDLGGVLQRGSAVNGSWVNVVDNGAWSEVTAVLRYSGSGGGAVNLGTGGIAKVRYQQAGKSLRLRYHFQFGTSPNAGSGDIYTQLPAGFALHATGIQKLVGTMRVPANGDYAVATDWALAAYFDPASPTVSPLFATSALNAAQMGAFRAGGGSPVSPIPIIPNGSPVVNGTRLDLSGVVELA